MFEGQLPASRAWPFIGVTKATPGEKAELIRTGILSGRHSTKTSSRKAEVPVKAYSRCLTRASKLDREEDLDANRC